MKKHSRGQSQVKTFMLRLDEKTVIEVREGTDVEKLKEKFASRGKTDYTTMIQKMNMKLEKR